VLSLALVVFINMKCAIDQFRVLSISAVTVGIIFSTFYICTIKEKLLSETAARYESIFKGVEVSATGATREGGKDTKFWLSQG